ncbi:MAG: DUF6152 family protein [Pseudohongiellaceae bacterium]|jgi:Family of unknown function (DUF6152)
MLIKPITNLVIAGCLLLSCVQLQAHHSFAMFDLKTKVELQGVVKEFQWTNPHTWIQLIVTDSNGIETEWSLEGAPVNMLVRNGWKNTSVKPGDKITVTGSPLVDGRPGATYDLIVFADGTELRAIAPR